MKITYVTVQFPSPSETFATNEVRFLTQHGNLINVHTLRIRHSKHSQMLEDRGIGTVQTSHNGLRSSAWGMVLALKRFGLLLELLRWLWRATSANRQDTLVSLLLVPRAFAILEEIERDTPDVVHLYWGHFPAVVGWLVQRTSPSVTTSIGLGAYDLVQRFGGTVEVARNADLVKTQARVNVAAISAFTGVASDEVEVVYNGVDLPRIEALTKGMEKVPGRVVSVGRLIASKGMDDVIRTFAASREVAPHATLSILGDGDERQSLEQLAKRLGIADAVTFAGHVQHDEVIRQMAAAEYLLFLSKSKSERLPNVVKEAMACRCVCITTKTSGIEELVADGVTGYLVAEGDIESSTAVLRSLMSRGDDLTVMIEAAYDHVARLFNLEVTAQRLANLWQGARDAKRVRSAAEDWNR